MSLCFCDLFINAMQFIFVDKATQNFESIKIITHMITVRPQALCSFNDGDQGK